jgi:hypothetical protein
MSIISSRASCSALDSATKGESNASRREAAKVTRLAGGMMRNWSSVDPRQVLVRRKRWLEMASKYEIDDL